VVGVNWDRVFSVGLESGVFWEVSGEKGFETVVHPCACILDICFGSNDQNAPIGFGGFNVVAPGCVHQDFMQCHSSVRVGQIGNAYVRVEVVIGDADNWYGNDVVQVLVVGTDKVAVCIDSNDGDDSAK